VTRELVSVIVPFYNAERFLDDAVASVLAQRYRPFELILVDDGSTDRSRILSKALATVHPEVRLLRLMKNAGPAAARNAGLAEATGSYVAFLDADDLMLPDRLSTQLAYLADHPDIAIVLCGAEQVLEPDAPRDLIRRRSLAARSPLHIMSMMIRRPAFDRVGGFEPALRVGEDLDWLFRAGRAGLAIGKIDTVLTRRRMHDRNLSYQTAAIQHAMLQSLRSLLRAR
jgi:glycosyltransferase involved in cell wall biosynthesis